VVVVHEPEILVALVEDELAEAVAGAAPVAADHPFLLPGFREFESIDAGGKEGVAGAVVADDSY
jgi:hypothetical protein